MNDIGHLINYCIWQAGKEEWHLGMWEAAWGEGEREREREKNIKGGVHLHKALLGFFEGRLSFVK